MKEKAELIRVCPEEIGVSSNAVGEFLTELESKCEPHGVMLMRYGKVFAEGWWAPYASDIRCAIHSHTKTYVGTAVGIAVTEGILKLTDHIIDIFSEEAPENPSEYLKELTVHHILSMSSGMCRHEITTEKWIKDYLSTPFRRKPGTYFNYDSIGSALLAAIVRKKTGMPMEEYLKDRLYDKIGIMGDNHRWLYMPDGIEFGGGGLYATTEDNLRLLKLYLDGGVWKGERILSKEFVEKAISRQSDSSTEAIGNPGAKDCHVGYGYQMWMCRPRGAYRADGLLGQTTIVDPKRNLIIAVTECADGVNGRCKPQGILDLIWKFLDKINPDVNVLPENKDGALALKERMKNLSLYKPVISIHPKQERKVSGIPYTVTEGHIRLEDYGIGQLFGIKRESENVRRISFTFEDSICKIKWETEKEIIVFEAGMDGKRRTTELNGKLPSVIAADGYWENNNSFCLNFRFIDSCFHRKYLFSFEKEKLYIYLVDGSEGFSFPESYPVHAEAKMEDGILY